MGSFNPDLIFSRFSSGNVDQQVEIALQVSHAGLIDLQPSILEFSPTGLRNVGGLRNVTIFGRSPGHIEITASTTAEDTIEYNSVKNICFRFYD